MKDRKRSLFIYSPATCPGSPTSSSTACYENRNDILIKNSYNKTN